jgi:hypothetical protein
MKNVPLSANKAPLGATLLRLDGQIRVSVQANVEEVHGYYLFLSPLKGLTQIIGIDIFARPRPGAVTDGPAGQLRRLSHKICGKRCDYLRESFTTDSR